MSFVHHTHIESYRDHDIAIDIMGAPPGLPLTWTIKLFIYKSGHLLMCGPNDSASYPTRLDAQLDGALLGHQLIDQLLGRS